MTKKEKTFRSNPSNEGAENMPARKKRPNGSGRVFKSGDNYYLQFTQRDGTRKCITLKDDSGKNITIKREAEDVAKKFLYEQQQIKEIETQEEYLAQLKAVRKFKAKLLITLDNAFDLAQSKPHIREACDDVKAVSRKYWLDFVSYVKENFNLKTLDEVERTHADSYIAYIRRNGRWNKTISYHPERCPVRKTFKDYQQGGQLSHTTLNRYHSVCKSVFSFLLPDIGYGFEENPFSHILPLKIEPVRREIFTPDELDKIFESVPPLWEGPFYVGRYTGLRLGDALTIKWESIEGIPNRSVQQPPDFTCREISLITRKTKHDVHVPVFPELNPILQKQWKRSRHSEYIFPELAEMYLSNRKTKINNMIQNYLQSLGIVTRIQVEGRSKKQTIKGFHSFRHTFSYDAEQKGVPPSTIKRWLGHKRIAMTLHYQDHANKQASLEGLKLMIRIPEPITAEEMSENSIRKAKILKMVQEASESRLILFETLLDNLPTNLEIPTGTEFFQAK